MYLYAYLYKLLKRLTNPSHSDQPGGTCETPPAARVPY